MHRARSIAQHRQVKRFGHPAAPAAAAAARTPQPHAARQPQPVLPRPIVQRPNDIFEKAIARAKSHEQPTPRLTRHHRRRRRTARILAGIAILLVAGLLMAWLQRPHIELRLASFQAGFEAGMPGYHLTDYKRGAIREQHGQVVMNYYSGDRYYRITQQSSNWNSQTLLDSAVAGASTDDSQVLESKGRLIYLYEGNNASWVDGGVRYDITGNAPLTRDDILKIVESM